MIFKVFIEPHERYEAIEAYGDRLTAEQIEAIKDAADGARICLAIGSEEALVTVIGETP